MRTGAIFARGSCRALKWMALVGMVFALGSAQAAAQPTVAAGDSEYVSTSTATTVTVEVTDNVNTGTAHAVTGSPDLADFEMPAGTNPTAVSVSGNMITLTFAGSTTGTPTLAYTAPADTRKQITSVATGVALGDFSDTVAEKDLAPVFSVSSGPDLEVQVNDALPTAGLSLPRATSGNGTITYSVSPTLPAGLTLNQPTQTTGLNISGTATSMTSGTRSFQLTATDADSNTAIGDVATVNFTITVGDVPARPAAPTVTPTGSMQASVTWTTPAINNFAITAYNLQYSTTGGPWINAGSNLPPAATTATVTFPAAGTYMVRVQAANSLGASPWSLGGSVTVTAAVPLAAPVLTTTAYTSRVGVAISPITLPATTGGFPPLTYSVSGQPAGLTFTAAPTGGGTLAGTPSAVTTGAQTVTYMVTDSDTPSAQQSATFTYTVTDVPGAPTGLTFTPTASSTTLDVSWTAPTVLNNLPITGYDLQYMPTGGTAWTVMTVTSTSAVITVPVAGSYDVRVRAMNADGSSAWLSGTGSSVATGVVLPPLPTTLSTGVMHRRGVAFTPVTLPAATGGLAPLTYAMSGLPAGMSFSPTTRELSGTPTAIAVAPANVVTYTATDASSPAMSASATFTFTVTDVPDAPALPTVTATADTRGSLDVMWVHPADNGSAIIDYGLRYKMSSASNWTVMTAAVTGTSTTLSGMPDGTSYDVQIQARNATGSSDWSESGVGSTAAAPVVPVKRGQITEFELIGDVVDKTIAGEKRHHVPEGSQGVDLSVKVQWTYEEIDTIGYNEPQYIDVAIMSGRVELPNWVSWIDPDGQDVHFPRTAGLTGRVVVRTPRASEIPDNLKGSPRHADPKPGTLDILILHDDHEAENDAFYIMATGGDVDLTPPRGGVDSTTLDVVIEDDDEQKVVIRNSRRSTGPTNVYEPAGDPEITDPVFSVVASPARRDLPLEVRLDMVDLNDQTVSAAKISTSAASLTLNESRTGTDNTKTATVHLPASDGDRMDDPYKLNASVVVYSTATGGYETIPVAEHAITVIDRHKLPDLMVSPATATVTEGGMAELTLTINRNPSDTYVGTPAINSSNKEKRQYTDEEVSIMLDMGAGSTAGASDFSVMTNPVTFPKRERGSYTASMDVEVMALDDDELDDGEMLVLDAMVAGAVAANGTDKDVVAGVSTLTIEDGTGKLVWAKTQEEVEAAVYAAKNTGMGDDMMFNPGDMIEIMGSALFNAAEGVTVSYSVMTSDSNVASTSVDSAGMAMVTAMAAGMADITITAHASMPSGLKILDQTDPREASIMFPVEVGLEALTLMLTGPEDMNVVEGGMGAMVTVTANRAVTEDVTVTLMRDRAMSTAGDDDFTAEPIVIAAGMMTGSTMVMAVEDGLMESVDNMAEELVLYGMAEGMAGEVSGQVKLYLWDAAVPALPIIAQLLLAAFLALGGYRRYRRR